MFDAFNRWPNATVAAICLLLLSVALAFGIASVPDQQAQPVTFGQKVPQSSISASLLQ